MLCRNGKIIFDSLKYNFAIKNIRSLALPQPAETPSASSPVSKVKRKKKPLMKSVLVGSVDEDYFYLSGNKKFDLPNVLLQFCQQMGNNEKRSNNHDSLKAFAENGFYELNIPSDSKDITYTDLLHFLEEIDLDPTLSLLLDIHTSIIIPAISNNGAMDQKEKYLKKLLNGDITGAVAITEESGGCDPSSICMTAIEDSNGSYKLNGVKHWVTNALDADFFLVIAKVPISNLKSGDEVVSELSAFIVDKNDSLIFEKYDSSVLNDCKLAKVTFKDVVVPANCVIEKKGYEIASESLKKPKFISAMCILNSLKKTITDVTKHVNSRKQLPRNLRENELVQLKLSNAIGVAYSLESMMYMTASILDKFVTDTTLEAALIQIYAFEQGMNALLLCSELLGSKVFDKNLHYEKLFHDLKGLSSFTNTSMTRLFVALHGLEYAGNHINDIVKKNRNPFNYPLFAMKKMIESSKFLKDKIKLDLKLYNNFHPSLKESAELLEYCVIRLRFTIEVMFSRYGADLIHRTIELNRLADIALEIFSVLSVISRASHSYCTGVMHCDQEILLAKKISYESYVRVKKILNDIMILETKTVDTISIEVGSYILSKQNYFIQHPLKHDI